jgi:ankyrin repeat protein
MHVCTHMDGRMFLSRLVLVWCGVMGCVGMGASQASKADMEAKQKDGATPLFFASQNGHDKVAELLVVRDEGQGGGKCPYV